MLFIQILAWRRGACHSCWCRRGILCFAVVCITMASSGVCCGTTKQTDTDPPWGLAVSDSTELRFVRSTLDAMAAGSAGGSGQFGSYLTLGPAMCARLQQDAKALLGSGKPMTIAFPGPNQVTCLTVTGFHDDVVIALVESPLFIEIGRQFADAEIRAATELERHWYYMLIPFEIYGRAITVADNGESVLLVDCIDGRVFWMEMLSDWWGPNSPEGAEEIARLIGVEARGD